MLYLNMRPLRNSSPLSSRRTDFFSSSSWGRFCTALLRRNFFCYLLILIVSAILVNNAFYSFCWSDESFYVSLSCRIADVGIFSADWTNVQWYWILIHPFFALFTKITGSSDGIYLYFRMLTLVLQSFAGCFAFFVMSRLYGKTPALFSAILGMVYARACINGPSYYTLCAAWFEIAVVCFLARAFLNCNRLFLVFAGVSVFFSILCNPYLAPICVFFVAVCALPRFRGIRRDTLVVFVSMLIAATIYIFCSIRTASLDSIGVCIRYVFYDPEYKQDFYHIAKRFLKMPKILVFPYAVFFLPCEIAAVCFFIRKEKAFRIQKKIMRCINAFIFAASLFYDKDVSVAIIPFFYASLYSCLSDFDFRIGDFLRECRSQLLFFVLPGFVLAYAFCLASNKGFGPCSIGILFCDIGMLASFKKSKNGICCLRWVCSAVLVLITLYFRVNLTYRDSRLPPHLFFVPSFYVGIERITDGPAEGLYTESNRKKQYDMIMDVARRLDGQKNKKIFVSPLCPFFYVAAGNLDVAAPTTWRLHFDDYRLEKYYELFPDDFPDFVLAVDEEISDSGDSRCDSDCCFLRECDERQYKKTELPCGILYEKVTMSD